MHKIFITICLICIYSTSFGFEANKPIVLTEQEHNWLEAHKNITLSVPKNFPPFLIESSTGNKGISVDYIELLNKKLNTNIKIMVTDNLAHSTVLFKQSKIDGFLFSASSRGFSDSLLPTDTILTSYFNLYSIKNSNIDSNENFKNMTIGYEQSMESTTFLNSLDNSVTKIKYDNYAELTQGLLNQDIDYAYDLFGYEYWINFNFQNYIHKSIILKDHKIDLSSYIRSDWPELVSILNKFNKNVRQEELAAIGNKWLNYNKNSQTSNLNLTDEEIQFLLENPIINYTHDKDWLPVEFIDKQGKHIGISADFLDEISKILNIQFNAIPLNSLKEAQQKIISKELDFFPLLSEDLARGNFLLTTPYVSLNTSIFSSDEHIRISGIQSLKDKKIAVIKGFAIHNWVLKNHPDLDLVLADDIDHAFKLLKEKKAYAFIENLMTGSAYISNNNLYDIRVIGDVPFVFELSIAVRKDLPMLHSAMQKALDAMPEHKKNEIFNRWMTIKYEHLFDYTLIYFIALTFIFLLVLIVIFVISNKRLKLEIQARNQSEKDLIDSKNKYKNLLHQASEGIIITDDNGNILSFNTMSENIFGYKLKDVLYKNISIFIPKEKETHHEYLFNNYQKFSSRDIFDSGREVRAKRKDGSLIDLQISISINDFSGTKQFLVIIQDITQRKENERELQESYKNFELLSNTSFEGIVIHKNGVLVHANEQANILLGYSTDELLNKQVIPIIMTADSASKARNHFENKLTDMLELELVHKSGAIIYCETKATELIFNNEKVRAISIKDVTAHKEQQAVLQQAKIVAENASNAKSKFISSMSHELRTPLNAIIGFSQLLKLDGLEEKDIQENANEILNAGNHLLVLINDILDLSAIESNNSQFTYALVDVHYVLESIIKLMDSLAKKHNITMQISNIESDKYFINVDQIKYKQILINIISNAIKYNKQNGLVSIETGITSDNQFEVKITDQGQGLTDEELDLIFQPFNRLSNENGNIQGTGIGLTITKELIDTMGGSISIQSEKDIGSTFTVYFPIQDS